MHDLTHVVGIDPGLIHTGLVRIRFEPVTHRIQVSHEAVPGPDAARSAGWISKGAGNPSVFIEGYKPRHHFGSDPKMIVAVNELRKATGGTVLLNTGVKKVVRRDLMVLVGVWTFGTVTHHQDLRAAARIALLGMLKDPAMNRLLADVVRDHLAGNTWQVDTV